ncbi:hypothetical protein EV702DRAFT_1042447 [Suillus placidus]|uniref:Uncharacterized protein n=1 Tax=Suillus placidus TaxID=48579 RepID=A0A9P7A4K3_9AGAM|nr:hypothetical protein EV702DRAFT_1042447 [Suillus placidus]
MQISALAVMMHWAWPEALRLIGPSPCRPGQSQAQGEGLIGLRAWPFMCRVISDNDAPVTVTVQAKCTIIPSARLTDSNNSATLELSSYGNIQQTVQPTAISNSLGTNPSNPAKDLVELSKEGDEAASHKGKHLYRAHNPTFMDDTASALHFIWLDFKVKANIFFPAGERYSVIQGGQCLTFIAWLPETPYILLLIAVSGIALQLFYRTKTTHDMISNFCKILCSPKLWTKEDGTVKEVTRIVGIMKDIHTKSQPQLQFPIFMKELDGCSNDVILNFSDFTGCDNLLSALPFNNHTTVKIASHQSMKIISPLSMSEFESSPINRENLSHWTSQERLKAAITISISDPQDIQPKSLLVASGIIIHIYISPGNLSRNEFNHNIFNQDVEFMDRDGRFLGLLISQTSPIINKFAEQSNGASADIHPDLLHKNEIIRDICNLVIQAIEKYLPNQYSQLNVVCFLLLMGENPITAPFTGLVLNIQCATIGHWDAEDVPICVVLLFGQFQNGKFVQYETGLVLDILPGDFCFSIFENHTLQSSLF